MIFLHVLCSAFFRCALLTGEEAKMSGLQPGFQKSGRKNHVHHSGQSAFLELAGLLASRSIHGMRQVFSSVITGAFLCILFVSCGPPKPIVLGYSAALSGRVSEIGVAGSRGAELAIRLANEAGGIQGRRVELVLADDKNSPEAAVSGDLELLEKGVNVIIGHMASAPQVAAMAAVPGDKVLFVSPTVTTVKLTGKDDNFIRVLTETRGQSAVLADRAWRIDKVRSCVVVYDTTNKEYTGEIISFFKEDFKAMGGSVPAEFPYSSAVRPDFESLATEIIKTGCDAVAVSASGFDLAILAQRLRKMSSKLRIYSGMWGMTQDLPTHGGSATDGILLAGAFDPFYSDADYDAFSKKFRETYQAEPSFPAVFAWNATQVVLAAYRATKDHSPAGIKKAILVQRKYRGLQHDFSIDEWGDSISPYSIFELQGGSFVRMKDSER